MPDLSPLLTPQEAAAFLGVSMSTLAHWRSDGKGPPFVRITRGTIRYSKADLINFSTTQEPTQ